MSKDRHTPEPGTRDLHVVGDDDVNGERLDEATAALRAALAPEPLDAMDHEALLAMTLGDDVTEMDEDEAVAAAALRDALDGRGQHPLAELAGALRAAQSANEPPRASADLDTILALAMDDTAMVGEEDRLAAETLRFALERGDAGHPQAVFAASLRHAETAAELDRGDGEALLALSLGVEASDEERRAAEAFTTAYEDGADHPLVALTTALRAAAGKLSRLGDLRHQRMVRDALERAPAAPQGRGVILGAIVALAAGIALFFGSAQMLETRSGGPTAQTSPAPIIQARSTQELFDPADPFPVRGGESERVGRIVDSRAADLRANRFAAWGVR